MATLGLLMSLLVVDRTYNQLRWSFGSLLYFSAVLTTTRKYTQSIKLNVALR